MFDISNDKYEELRLLLDKQNRRTYAIDEAKEIGNGLVDFYLLLAEMQEEEGELSIQS